MLKLSNTTDVLLGLFLIVSCPLWAPILILWICVCLCGQFGQDAKQFVRDLRR